MSKLPNPDLPFTQWDADTLLAACLWGEARGSSLPGLAAVACTILNRMQRKKATVHQIVLAPKQFSSFNADDPNSRKLAFPLANDTAQTWERCYAVAHLALEHALADMTHGATHYYAESMPEPPYWAKGDKGWRETARLGGHVFGIAP